MSYFISLKQFEGPLDLLLHLINQAKVDIKDIFISEITEQYLDSLQGINELDMNTASEFLVMAALLLEIKSRALLPKPPEQEDGEDTPEQQLIRRLEEYKLYKESAGKMHEFELAALHAFSKLPEEYPVPPPQIELTGLSLDGLLKALSRIISRRTIHDEPGRVIRSIVRERFTIEQCVFNLTKSIQRGPVLFSELLSDDVSKDEIITYFMALLELMKLNKLCVQQEKVYDDILIMPKDLNANDG